MPSLIDLHCLPQQPVSPEGQTRSPMAQWESVLDHSGTKSLRVRPWETYQGVAEGLQVKCSSAAWPLASRLGQLLGGQHLFPTPWCTGHSVDRMSNNCSPRVEKWDLYWLWGVTRELISQENQPHLAASPKAKVRPQSETSFTWMLLGIVTYCVRNAWVRVCWLTPS